MPDHFRYPVRADAEWLVVGTAVSRFGTTQTLHPPAGRDYHPALARFAVEGRWLPVGPSVVDLAVGKRLKTSWGAAPIHVPGIGLTSPGYYFVVWVPLPSRLPPDDLLALWVQVVVRGELGPDGEFVRWNEETWEKKRQELASRPVPFADFPFPGRVATDTLYWFRKESDFDLKSARELLRRAEAAGDADEADYWRAHVKLLAPEAVPAPRPEKP